MASALPTPLRLDPQTQQRVIGIGLDLLSDTALLWLVTLGAGGIWTLAVMHPDLWRIVAACGYTGSVYLPLVWLKRHRDRS